MQEAMLLRVNQNSVFGKALVALLNSEEGLSKDELNTIGGMKRASWGINVAKIWFDNLIVDRVADNYTASYINVVPDSSGYYLRVQENSDLGKTLRFLLDTGTQVHEDDLAEAAGKERVRWCLKSVSDWFDNLSINITSTDNGKYFTASYMDVTPTTEVVGAEVGDSEPVPVDGSVVMVWPEAPPVPSKMKNYDRTYTDTHFRPPTVYD